MRILGPWHVAVLVPCRGRGIGHGEINVLDGDRDPWRDDG